MASQATTIEREGRAAVVRLRGDLVVPTVRGLDARLRAEARRRQLATLVLDFTDAGRIDSSGIAVVSLIRRELERGGKRLELRHMHDQHRAALQLSPELESAPVFLPGEVPSALERLGAQVIGAEGGLRAFGQLVADTLRQSMAVLTRRARLPEGALRRQVALMGADGIFIVALLSFLTGTTMAFQGAVQLQRFGAGVFVADMIGMAMVRELAPLMTAVIITGRTGAAIAAELGTMQVRSEIDALWAMGIHPVRYLVVPRLAAITVVVPALTLMAIFIGILGGTLVAWATLDLSVVTFWSRVVDRVDLLDFAHGLSKSVVFAWIIGLSGSYLGMRASGDASSVGTATTRTVVASVFSIIVVDAVFATIATFVRYR